MSGLPLPDLDALKEIERRLLLAEGATLRLVCVGAPRINSYGVSVQVLMDGQDVHHVELDETLMAVLGVYGNDVVHRFGVPGVDIRWPTGSQDIEISALRETDGVVVETMWALIDNYASRKASRPPMRSLMAGGSLPERSGALH